MINLISHIEYCNTIHVRCNIKKGMPLSYLVNVKRKLSFSALGGFSVTHTCR